MDVKNNALRGYVTGFIISLLCCLAAYQIVVYGLARGIFLGVILSALALIQFVTQAICFLHVGKEKWQAVVFACMLVIAVIILGGSIWIMANLDSNMVMPESSRVNEYVRSQDGL